MPPAEAEKSGRLAPLGSLVCHLNAFPKSHMIFDLPGCFTWIRVILGSVFVHLAIDDDIVVAGFAFPRANRVGIARSKVFGFDGGGREVVIVFHHNRSIALGKNRTIPYCFHVWFRLLRLAFQKIDPYFGSGYTAASWKHGSTNPNRRDPASSRSHVRATVRVSPSSRRHPADRRCADRATGCHGPAA